SSTVVISNIASLIPIKLDSTSYLLWKSLFEPIFRGHKLIDYVDGSLPSPALTHPTYDAWYEKDQMFLSWINATLSESALPYIVGVTSSMEAWAILNRRYASTTPSHVMALKRQLNRIKRDNLSMQEYLHKFKVLSDQLAARGSPISDDDLVLHVLDGLPSSYRQFTSVQGPLLLLLKNYSCFLFVKN
ncbi:UBN2_3 domain-containing protein, partial [Cephalotus follicularis]